ncbi:hypothetical protein [Arhodomonas aquaeolei]|uniref:hypothetical protein n=1 Tax=Arhodomonas aquaeolei TaxID=2369 RepID=UPI0012EBA186|nr:hypothetical protein [Arhodomonas aquaeolei]
MSEIKTNQEKALSKIKTAFWAAVILVVINGGLRVLAITDGNSSMEDVIIYLADPIIMLALAFWLLKGKSRAASIALLVLFLLGKASLFLPLLGVDLSPEQQNTFIEAATRQIIWIAIFGYAFIQGILGAFTFQRSLNTSNDT